MAQPLQSINLVSPAFKGINTEDSPLAQDTSYAETADNAIIDKRGQLAARKGVSVTTTDATELGSDKVKKVFYFEDSAGNNVVFSTGNNKIMTGTTTLVDATPGSYSITADNWKIVNFNDSCYFFQRGYEPLVYSNALGAVTKMSSVAGSAGVTSSIYGNEALAAYGRLWVVDNASDANVIYWSDLLNGVDWTGGSSGSINIEKVWPDGADKVKALAAHNNKLVILGEHSILVYEGADSPASMALSDTVAGVGCVCRNSVQHIGTDVLFMSHSGLRSFGRTIQEKSMPLTDLSRNIKQELIQQIQNRSEPTASVYSPENYFYLITFPGSDITYCFDLRGQLDNGSYRVTRWVGSGFTSYNRKNDGTVYVGTADGIGTYAGYLDNASSYQFKYASPALTFGDASRLKVLKKIRPTLINGAGYNVGVKWSYDFGEAVKTAFIDIDAQYPAYFNQTDEFNVAEFTSGTALSKININATGDGSVVTVGLETQINGQPFSIQEFNVLALIGKTV
jgi:hypothetical protein